MHLQPRGRKLWLAVSSRIENIAIWNWVKRIGSRLLYFLRRPSPRYILCSRAPKSRPKKTLAILAKIIENSPLGCQTKKFFVQSKLSYKSISMSEINWYNWLMHSHWSSNTRTHSNVSIRKRSPNMSTQRFKCQISEPHLRICHIGSTDDEVMTFSLLGDFQTWKPVYNSTQGPGPLNFETWSFELKFELLVKLCREKAPVFSWVWERERWLAAIKA